MATVIEQERQADIEYVMPEARVGMVVTFYRTGELDAGRRTIGFVSQVHNSLRRVTVYVPNDRTYEGVRHITDPKLKLSPEFKENGAWEYSPEYIYLENRLAALSQELDRLSALVARRGKQAE